ncbi:hypothetical protein VKT23_007260 [Stygiomarasmius scandens]|uniref:Uncharacterized protein n=1 Tax=Marasmiellus scandens TaxID=2682957 RepID=A0ABR1JK42_9AGAR
MFSVTTKHNHELKATTIPNPSSRSPSRSLSTIPTPTASTHSITAAILNPTPPSSTQPPEPLVPSPTSTELAVSLQPGIIHQHWNLRRLNAKVRHQAYESGLQSLHERLDALETKMEAERMKTEAERKKMGAERKKMEAEWGKLKPEMETKATRMKSEMGTRIRAWEKEICKVKEARVADLCMTQKYIEGTHWQAKAECDFLVSESIARIIQSRNNHVMHKLDPLHAETLCKAPKRNYITKWMDPAKDNGLSPELQAACSAARSELEPNEIFLLMDLDKCRNQGRDSRNSAAHPIPTLSTARQLVRQAIIDTFPDRQPNDRQKVIDYAMSCLDKKPGRKATEEELENDVVLIDGLVPLFKEDNGDSYTEIGPVAAMVAVLGERIQEARDDVKSYKKRICDDLDAFGDGGGDGDGDDERKPKRRNVV